MHSELQSLLRQRLEVIADRDLYQADPEAHLNALKAVSDKIHEYSVAHQGEFDSRMRHYLSNSSFQKALDHLISGKTT